MVSHENGAHDAARARAGRRAAARAATRAAYLGNEAPHLDGLVSLELLRARARRCDIFHPRRYRWRAPRCGGCGSSPARTAAVTAGLGHAWPPPVASSDRRLSATSDGHVRRDRRVVKGPDESDDEFFAMDDERPSSRWTTSERSRFPCRGASPSTSRRVLSGAGRRPARATPRRQRRHSSGERFDALLQCWVGGHAPRGRRPPSV